MIFLHLDALLYCQMRVGIVYVMISLHLDALTALLLKHCIK